jgi:16S rRNA A1518/A1519 N6-dimethyltransferase RsmA/KsgA/DIM1 with predicted DNA glycosylase/AP lyase activity
MKSQVVMLYKPDGGVKEYEKAEVVYLETGKIIFDNLNNGERIESNLPYVIATKEN